MSSQKTKSSTGKPEKDHKSKEKPKEESKKRLWQPDEQFLCVLQFQNTLPNVPSGPFFKQVPQFHSFEQYATFQVSSLEKSFVWQPHFGPDAGIKLDLVDQESILIPDNVAQPDDADKKFLTGFQLNKKSSNRLDVIEKQEWLRRTTYIDAKMYQDDRKFKEETNRPAKVPKITENPFSVGYISASFENVAPTLEREARSKVVGEKSGIEWSMEILPDDLFKANPFSIVRFDEDIRHQFDKKNTEDKKMRDVSRAIITNARPTKQSGKVGESNSMAVSLVASLSKLEESAEREESEHFDWFSDFKMDINKSQVDDFFVISVDEQAVQDGVTAAIKYCPIQSRIELHKLMAEEIDTHESFVWRRPLLEGELANGGV